MFSQSPLDGANNNVHVKQVYMEIDRSIPDVNNFPIVDGLSLSKPM